MRRTFNYTSRSRVTQSMVKVRLRWSTDSLSPTFMAEIDLDELKLNPDSKIYIDAARQDTMAFMRFDYGTVAKMVAPSDTLLSEFSRESKPKFFINGRETAGRDINAFSSMIDEELKK